MPSVYTNDVDLYCTHADLIDELGGSERQLRKLLPPEPNDPDDPTKAIRQQALRDVLKTLSRRTPPILEPDITVPAELKDAVVYGTLYRLYRAAATTPDDMNAKLATDFETKFNAELAGLRLTIDDGASVDVASIAIFRR